MDLRQVVGSNVRQMREAAELSQEELAHRASVHVTYLSGVENGRRNPTIMVVGRLAKRPWNLSGKASGSWEVGTV